MKWKGIKKEYICESLESKPIDRCFKCTGASNSCGLYRPEINPFDYFMRVDPEARRMWGKPREARNGLYKMQIRKQYVVQGV